MLGRALIEFGELPRDGWIRIWRFTGIATLASAVASVLVAQGLMLTLSKGLDLPGVVASFVLPVVLGAPMMFYHLLRSEQLRLANQRLEVLASTDWLTSCLNRRAFSARATNYLSRVEGQQGALLLIDADHFKVINDRFGHDRGDDVLRRIVDTLQLTVGPNDLVGRLGGEEFGVLLTGLDPASASAAAERIRHAINTLSFGAGAGPVTVSIGVAAFEQPAQLSELYSTADQLLYEAKQAGRNRVAMAPAPLSAAA